MNERIRQLAEQCFDITKDNRCRVEYSTDSYGIEKFAQLIADHCASICMSQADRRNIRNAFGIPEESNIKYKGPDPSNSIESQYNRELNTTRIQ
jgi:hypothetical protein